MSMRTSSLLIPALLAACSPAADDGASSGGGWTAEQAADAPKIPCVRGGGPLKPECSYDQTDSGDGPVLTLRFPDGAFRKLLITKDGRGVVAYDGAEPAKVAVTGDSRITVAIGQDRFELPATVSGGPPAAK